MMQVSGEMGNLTHSHAQTLNRSSPKVPYVITSWISTHAKFSHDPSRGFFSPYVRNCASKMFTRLLFSRVLPTAP